VQLLSGVGPNTFPMETGPSQQLPSQLSGLIFFTLLLVKPGSFEWAQSFVQSPAWDALNQLFNGNSFTFSLLNSPPLVLDSEYSWYEPPEPVCLELLEEDAEDVATNPSADPTAYVMLPTDA